MPSGADLEVVLNADSHGIIPVRDSDDMLPDVWSYRNPYTADTPHPGFTIAQQYLRVHQREGPEDVPLGPDGLVVPSFTASRVWEGAFSLLKYLEMHAAEVNGGAVLELGAGTGVVGESYHRFKKTHICPVFSCNHP